MKSVCYNGKIIRGGSPVLAADNRGYRYGDGLFETMKLADEKILLEQFHFERLKHGMDMMGFDPVLQPDLSTLQQSIISLCRTNKCAHLARVRLSVFRGHGGLYDHDAQVNYLIECVPLAATTNHLNEEGLVIDIYPDARKSCDIFSGIKSSSFLPYAMAAQYAKQNGFDDCILLNTQGGIADSTIANIFLLTGGRLVTPALSEGCVAGVMRRQLLATLQKNRDFETDERPVAIGDLLSADEVFLTNSINSIRWVKQFRDRQYGNTRTISIYNLLSATLQS